LADVNITVRRVETLSELRGMLLFDRQAPPSYLLLIRTCGYWIDTLQKKGG
jgi:hypothetical protein